MLHPDPGRTDATQDDTPSSSSQSSDAADRSPATVSDSLAGPEREDRVGADEGGSLAEQALDVGVVARGAGLGDPWEEEFPELDVTGTIAWLTGAGAAAVGLVVETAELWTAEEPDCAAVAGRLDRLGSPGELLEAAVKTPDPVTAEVLLGLRAAVLSSLAACDVDDSRHAMNAWQWAVAHRRLVELGVIR